jgi:hypothetical protein
MDDEIEVDLETENLEASSSDQNLDTGPKIITNFEILQIIFSRKTAPHAVALSIFLIVLGVLSRSSSQFLVDLILILGFGFSVGYLLTAVLMRFDLVKNLSIGGYRTILLVPLTLSLLVSLSIWYVIDFTEDGNQLKDLLSFGLVVIFVLWQFAQAWWMRVPFKELAISRMSKVVSRDQSSFGKFANILSPLFWSVVGFGIFTFLESQGTDFSSTFKIIWFVLMVVLGSVTFYLLFRMNSKHWSDPMISVFSAYFAIGYWSFLAYHVAVMLYSREKEPSFVFDLIFMVITIMLVIYSLSAQALRSETRNEASGGNLRGNILNRHNVIFYAISFTAAYGASSFFLASRGTMFVDNIKSVGFISHLIVLASGILVLLLVNYTALVGRGLIDRGFVESLRTPKDN